MKKQLFAFVILVIIVVAGVKIFTEKGTKKTAGKNAFKKQEMQIVPQVEPSGNLTSFPDSVSVYFSEPIFGANGVEIEENDLKNFIEISPKIRAKGLWTDSNVFKIRFLEKLKPSTEYSIKIKKIPLHRKLSQNLTKKEFKIITPPFKPISATPLSIDRKTAVLKIIFNLEVDKDSLRDRISIVDGEGIVQNIASISYQKTNSGFDKKSLIVKFPLKHKGIYTVNLKKGIKSVYNFKTTKDYSLDFSISDKNLPIIIKGVRVRDLGDSFAINIYTVSLKNKPVSVDYSGVKNFITISPEVNFECYATKGNLSISGNFKPGQNYTLILFPGIKGTNGEVLKNKYTANISIPKHSPKLSFIYRGRYFGTKGEWKLPIVAKRLKEVNLNLFLIPAKNLTLWYSYAGGSKWSVEEFGKLVKANVKINIPQSNGELYFIDLKKLIGNPEKGIYFLKANAYSKETKRNYWANTKFTISNISIIAKFNRREAAVWVVNSNDATPVRNAKITVLDSSNIEMGKGETDGKGFAKINLKGIKSPYTITVTTDRDWTYLNLRDSLLPSSSFDISGDRANRDYIAYLYFERNLIRPGESVNLSVIVRKNKTFEPLSIPVKIKVLNPNGTKIKEFSSLTDNYGFAEFKFKTDPSFPTGQYFFNVFIGDKNISSEKIFVEAFAPERMSLKAKFPDYIDLSQPFTIETEAFYLFGAPASGETIRGKISLEETNFSPEGYKNYSFGPLPYYYSRAKLDETLPPIKINSDGKNKIKIMFKSLPEFHNPVKLTAYLEVSEGGSGRATRKSFTKTVYTKDYYIGLNCSSSKVTEGVPLKIKGIALTGKGNPATTLTKVKYRIFKVAYNYDYYFYNEFSWRKNSTLIPLTEEKETSVSNGKFEITYVPQNSYDDIVVEVRGDKNIGQLFISGWGWYGAEKAETPETLILKTDKNNYDYGDSVKVMCEIPFEGKILWTVEGENVISYKWKEAKGKTARFDFEIPEGYTCVYVSALLVHTGNNYLVERAFGIKRVKISPEKFKLKINAKIPEKAKPGDSITIQCRGDEEFEATISIVDQGVLQITNFKTPNPFEGILKPIALEIESADGFGWLVKKYLATGGGMMREAKGFATPRFTKIVSIWSGKIKSDRRGNLKYRFKIPQYNGRLRVMVCGVSKNKFGAVSKDITVSSDLIAMPTIPRFLRTKDRANIPITLINNTGKEINGRVEVKFKSLNKKDFNTQFSIEGNGKKTITVLFASEKAGNLTFSVRVFSASETYFEEDYTIPVFPSKPRIAKVENLKIETHNKNIIRYFENWEDKGYYGEIYLSPLPGLTKIHLAENLLGYPYGCIEQVSSKTLAMIKLKKLLPLVMKDYSLERYREYIRDGIGKILSMQTVSGGFSYWPGDPYPDKWASVYATFVLLEAKEAGFSVPQSAIDAALNYIQTSENLPPMGFFVLSKAGKLQKMPAIIQQIEDITSKEKLKLVPLMWYTASLYNCGKSDRALILYQKGLSIKPENKRRSNYDFYSPLKAEAIRVFVGEEINYDEGLTATLIEKLAGKLSKYNTPGYYTTQEIVWSILAIGNYADKYLKDNYFNATLKIDGKSVKGEYKNGVYRFTGFNLPGKEEIVIASNRVPFFVEVVHYGFPKNYKDTTVKNGIEVRERLLDYKTGKEISSLKQGQLAVIEITYKSQKRYLENCAIEIPLAGGLEAENPRLNQASLPSWANNQTNSYDYIDIRDDRIIVFGSIDRIKEKIFLTVRATISGDFYLAPAKAVAMYSPFINGKDKGKRITVAKPDGF